MACARNKSDDDVEMMERNIVVKTEPEEINEVKIEPMEMVEVKMEPIHQLDDCDKNNDQLPLVWDGILKNEAPVAGSTENPSDIPSTSKGDITHEEDEKFKSNNPINADVDLGNEHILQHDHQHEVQNGSANTEVYRFHCEYCSFKSNYKISVVRHERLHTGEKPFICKYCDYKSTVKISLVRHERTHTGEEPFKCDQCNYCCLQKGDLVRHKRIHTGEKPFNCNYCNFKCSQKAHLIRHTRIHTGERPYKCSLCPYESAQNSCLKIHIQTKHKQIIT